MIAVIEMLKRRMAAIWLGYGIAFCFAAAIPVTNWITLRTAMEQIRFGLLDSRDTVYLSSLGTFETAGKMHEEMSRMATETMFSRNPDGYDYEDRKTRLFSPAALIALNADTGRDAIVFRDQQMHTKCETGHVREIPIDANNVKVGVDFQILRTGLDGQQGVQ